MAITLTPEQFKAKYGANALGGFQPKKTYLQDAGQDIKETVSGIKNVISETKGKIQNIANAEVAGQQGGARSFGQAVGAIAGGISSGIGELFKGAVKMVLPQSWEDKTKQTIEKVAPAVIEHASIGGISLKDMIDKYSQLDEKTKRDVDSLLGLGSLGLDVATMGLGKGVAETGIKKGLEVGGEVATTAGELATKGTELAQKATSKIVKTLETPKLTPLEASKQVLQGSTKELKQGLKGLAELDTEGVSTFKDLGNKITGKITELAQKVDADLGMDTTKQKLKDLVVTAKTPAGTVVKSNPVENALKQLGELYNKIGDKVKATEIKELFTTAQKQGLTKLEVNDIARVYGMEFGQKAFNKIGDALTSVNAQMFENTRKALKNVARSGIQGEEAKLADQAMSNLYNTQRLIQKNIEAVNKLQQKIAPRSGLEKLGNFVAKYGNMLSGGTIRGFVGGLLPRGAGYKVMNALDLEEALSKNLKIIQDAIKSGNDKELESILKNLKY